MRDLHTGIHTDSLVGKILKRVQDDKKRKTFCSLFTISYSPLKAFTLAEVLITLGIIGVVAAMTIPTLMNATQDIEYKTGYKKAYSTATQAWMSAVADDNIVFRTSWNDEASKVTNFNAFKSYFKVIKDCNNNNNSDCWNPSGEKMWGKPSSNDTLAFIDSSGVAWSLSDNGNSSGADILVDTNGLKKPNKLGQDRAALQPICENGTFLNGIISNCIPVKIVVRADCLDTTCGPSSYSDVCPSVTTHACYYTSWITGEK